jgi:molybdopterin molybdotransferase
MITVEEAEKLILAEAKDYGNEIIPFDMALGRVLAENIKADRDLPPFNRVTMDGIAINYSAVTNGVNKFKIRATQAAGEQPVEFDQPSECVEIMTGAVLPKSADTVIPYESVDVADGIATIKSIGINKGQCLHLQGADKKKGELIISSGRTVSSAVLNSVSSVGESEIRVKRLPKVVIISSGDELVNVHQTPLPYQIRRSNSYSLQAALKQLGIDAATAHIPDDPDVTKNQLKEYLHHFDVVLLTGGISMGKFDYIPKALEELSVQKIFHKVKQRPGKPFWFGKHENGTLVFAFPGNPVATFMCFNRYFIPWLNASLKTVIRHPVYAVLSRDFSFEPQLQYFLQVKLQFNEKGMLIAEPVEGNGSGDFVNLADTDAFMELPLAKTFFKAGEVYRTWPFEQFYER